MLALYLRTVEDNERVEIKMRVQLKEINGCTKGVNLVDPTIQDITPDKFTTFGWDTGRKKIFEYENIDQITLTIDYVDSIYMDQETEELIIETEEKEEYRFNPGNIIYIDIDATF